MRRYLVGPIDSYRVLLYVGCVAGVLAGASVAQADGLDDTTFAVTAIGLLVPAFLGARLWFVVRHRDPYCTGPGRILSRTEGGSALYGGLVLSIVVSVPALAFAGLRFWRFWDAASFTMLVGLFFTRFGCLLNGCCGGRPTDRRVGIRLPNPRGEVHRRYPTQLIEAAWAAALLAGAIAARPRIHFDGVLFIAVVAAYSTGRLWIESLRERPTPPNVGSIATS